MPNHEEQKRAGVIGLGLMGTALTERLLEHGYRVVVWNRTRRADGECPVRGDGWLLSQGRRDLWIDISARLMRLASGNAVPPSVAVLLTLGCLLRAAEDDFGCTQTADRLSIAFGGTGFHNAFVTTSICCVSRASILTGQYARRHGVHDFKTPVEKLDSVYPMLLRPQRSPSRAGESRPRRNGIRAGQENLQKDLK